MSETSNRFGALLLVAVAALAATARAQEPFDTSAWAISAGGFGSIRSVLSRPATERVAFFLVDEDRVPTGSGRDPSYDFWRTRFAEDPGVLGTTVRINGTAFTVAAPPSTEMRSYAVTCQTM